MEPGRKTDFQNCDSRVRFQSSPGEGGLGGRSFNATTGLLTVGCPPAGRDDPIRSAFPCGYVWVAALLSPTRAYQRAPVGQRSMQIPHRTHSLSSMTNSACEVCARVVTS